MASKKESTPKSVQELSNNGEEPPAKFFHKGNDAGISDVSVPLIEIPVVDIGLLTSPSTKKEELQKHRLALTSWGCFQVINHGMTSSFLDKMREVGKKFFALPMEKKQK